MEITIRIKLIVLLSIINFFSFNLYAKAEFPFEIALRGNYIQSDKSIQLNDKVLSLNTASAGVELSKEIIRNITVFGNLGVGYSPKETATFAGAIVSGPVDTNSYGYGIKYNWLLDSLNLGFKIDYLSNSADGSFSGFRNNKPVTASADYDFTMQRQEIKTEYPISNTIIRAGLGQYEWKINGLAKGVLDQGIRASTRANGSGDDNYYRLGLDIDSGLFVTNIDFYNYNLKASNKVNLNEITIKFSRK